MTNKARNLCLQALAPLLGALSALVFTLPGFMPNAPSNTDSYGVAVGMTQADVLDRLGRPTERRGECWIWIAPDRSSAYTVTFENGKVKDYGPAVG